MGVRTSKIHRKKLRHHLNHLWVFLESLAWIPPVLQSISETFETKAPRVVVIFLELETHGFDHVMATEKQAMAG